MEVSRRRFVRTVVLGGAVASYCRGTDSLASQASSRKRVSLHLASENFATGTCQQH